MKRSNIRINYYAEKSDFDEIKTALKKNKDLRMSIRYTAILSYLQGYTYKEIASLLNLSSQTISSYVKKYKSEGIAGLNMGKSSGAPCHLNKEQEAELINIILTKTPDEVGFTARKNWDTTIIRQLVFKLYYVSYCQRGILRVLYRNGLSFTRPTYSLEKEDKSKQEKFKSDFELLKNLLEGTIEHIIFEDESMIRDYQAISKTWFLKSRKRIIPTTGKHRGVKLLGILNYETGQVFCTQDERYDANVFLEFLKKVVALYPTGEIVMILDNSRIHHDKLLKTFLEGTRRLKLIFLPPYSPNLIEGLWKWLKADIINNVFYHTVKQIKSAVEEFINNINLSSQKVIDRLCIKL